MTGEGKISDMSTYELNLGQDVKTEVEFRTKELATKIVKDLVAERKRRGITQQDIAGATGMKTANVTRVESCRNTPTLDVLTRYAKALGKELKVELIV